MSFCLLVVSEVILVPFPLTKQLKRDNGGHGEEHNRKVQVGKD